MPPVTAPNAKEPLDRHIAVVFAMLLAMALLANVLSKYLSDLFGDRDFGLLTVVLEVAGLSMMGLNFHLRAGLRYLIARARSGEEDVPPPQLATGLCLAFDLCSISLMSVLLFAAAPLLAALYDAPTASHYLRILCPFLIFMELQGMVETVLNAAKRFGFSGLALLCRNSIPLVSALAGALLADPQQDRILAATLGYGVGLVGTSLVWAACNREKISFCPGLWRHRGVVYSMARIAWPVWLGELVKSGLPRLLMLLAGMVVLSEAGFLRIALVTISPAMVVGFAIRVVAIPLMAERNAKERSRMADLLIRAHNFMLFPVLAILWVAGPAFIRWYYKPEFHGAADYLPVLLLALLSNSFVRVASFVLVGAGSAASYAWIMAVVALIAVPGIALASLVGHSVTGAAWFMAAGWTAGAGVTLWLIGRHGLRLRWARTFAEPAGWAVLIALATSLAQGYSFGVLAAAVCLSLSLPILAVRKQLRTAAAVAA